MDEYRIHYDLLKMLYKENYFRCSAPPRPKALRQQSTFLLHDDPYTTHSIGHAYRY